MNGLGGLGAGLNGRMESSHGQARSEVGGDLSRGKPFGRDALLRQNTDVGARALAFEDRLDAAMKRMRKPARPDQEEAAGKDLPPGRVLAISETALPTGLPSPAQATPPVEAPGHLAGLVQTIEARVAEALRAEAVASASAPQRWEVDLAGVVPGLHGFALTMSADAIDIALARAGAPASAELAAAAQVLADRLRMRFSRRVVRVTETQAADAGPEREDLRS